MLEDGCVNDAVAASVDCVNDVVAASVDFVSSDPLGPHADVITIVARTRMEIILRLAKAFITPLS
jgi:hypothetical protein